MSLSILNPEPTFSVTLNILSEPLAAKLFKNALPSLSPMSRSLLPTNFKESVPSYCTTLTKSHLSPFPLPALWGPSQVNCPDSSSNTLCQFSGYFGLQESKPPSLAGLPNRDIDLT